MPLLVQRDWLLLGCGFGCCLSISLLCWLFSAFKQGARFRRHEHWLISQFAQSKEQVQQKLLDLEYRQIERFNGLSHLLERRWSEQNEATFDRLNQNSHLLQDTLRNGLLNAQRQITDNLNQYTLEMTQRIEQLTQTVNTRLGEISGQVEQRLAAGFDKTTETFTDIVKRLALIDDAQKKLSELSTNVVSLQAVLADKRSRGAFGEVQLKNLITNILPTEHYSFQHTMNNGNRADCLLFLPPPTGNIAIDSKFPLENFQKMTDFEATEPERKKAQQQFRQDIKKHIQDIASKYIIRGETSDGAIMFIPAEAVFAEIHAHFPDLVEIAQRVNVWLASPTTMMAILTTACAVLKDNATRTHIHVIQEHLKHLSDDFNRFDERMNKLARHIDQAHEDVKQVHTSARKISSRFTQIEKVEQLDRIGADIADLALLP